MASECTAQENFQLIELVQLYPVQYDPSRDDYKGKNLKQNAWKQVADQLLQKDNQILHCRQKDNPALQAETTLLSFCFSSILLLSK